MSRPKGARGCNAASAAAAKRKGRLSLAEQSTLIAAAQSPLSPEKAAEKLAPILERSESAIKAGIIRARQELQTQASDYVRLHRKAAEKAAEMGNSKPTEWMLERIEAGGERVVEAPSGPQQGSGIQIILAPIALGGTKHPALSDSPLIDVTALPTGPGPASPFRPLDKQ